MNRAAAWGRIGGLTMRATHDPLEYTQRARDTFRESFLTQVDPEGVLDPAEREKRADAARRAHYSRMALKSAEARRARKAGG